MTFWCVELCVEYEGSISTSFFQKLSNASDTVEDLRDWISKEGMNDMYVTLEEVEFEDTQRP